MPTPLAARVRAPAPTARQRGLAFLRRLWRGGLLRRWRALRGPILLIVGLGSLVLGTIGYLQLTSVRPRYGFLDALYRAITLFAFGGAATPPIPVALQIARIGAPLLTGYAAIGAVLALSREQARVASIRLFVRHHVVIAGLGGTGRRLAAALVDHVPVVVIEANPASEHLVGARLRGVRTLTGNAADPKLLRQAGIEHAQTLVIACGGGGINVDVAAAAIGALENRGQPLTVFLHLENLDLWSSLAAEGATFRSPRSDVRLEYFNAMAIGAQLLVERQPPFSEGRDPRQEHVLIVGVQGIGEQLILQLARLWVSAPQRAGVRLRLTLTGPDADSDLAGLLAQYPTLEQYLTLATRPLAIDAAAFQAGAAMAEAGGLCDVTRAYVTLADESVALLAALALHARPDTSDIPVTVAVADDHAGVSSVLGSERGRFTAIEAFGVLSEAMRSNLLLRGTNELLARAQHSQWLMRQRADAARAVVRNPNLRPWEELDETQRERNRRFADDVHAKLALVHCMLVPRPLPARDEELFAFTDQELDALSRQEHERWMAVMLESGWRYGVPRDDARRIHDQIKPWAELDETNRDKDRDAVRGIPRMLAVAGFAIRRLTAGTPTA
ncbi:MAG: RyR domain-containing protein [Solirubrobacteraceae bacterium]